MKVLTQQLINRRRAMLWLVASAGAIPLAVACGSDSKPVGDGVTGTDGTSNSTTTDTETTTRTQTSDGSCSVIPEETAGPYPGDGSNGANALLLSGIVRQDITASIGGSQTVAEGIPLKIELTLVNANGNCAELSDYVVYLWHADRQGQYSMYSNAVKDENYLRGIQAADSQGTLSFDSIFPGCYDGRWPHIHFEVYRSLTAATNSKNKIATSQIALPASACKLVYANSSYSSSVSNFSRITLASDNVFSDGSSLQLPTIDGNATDGFTLKLTVAVKA